MDYNMDINDLKKSVLSVLGIFAFGFVVIQGLIYLVTNCAPVVLAGLLFLVLFVFCIIIDYERRQFNKTLRK